MASCRRLGSSPSAVSGLSVLEDQELWSHPAQVTEVVANLVHVVAASTPREMQAALILRQFRMWVWKAAARSGEALAYFTDVQLRFAVGNTRLAVTFDHEGWSQDIPTADAAASTTSSAVGA
jgi:hypothetical protein